MKCAFCNIWRKNTFENEAPTHFIKQRLVESWNLGCSIISFTGGEPLLRNDIGKLLEFSSKEIGMFTGLVTNGILLDKRIDALAKHTDALAVSFDVNNKQVFNRTRGVDTFEKVKKNIQQARRLGVEIDLISVITKDTYQHLDDTIEFAKSLELPIHFSAVDNVPRETTDELDVKDMKAAGTSTILERLKEEKKKYKKIHFESDYFKFQDSGGFNKFIRRNLFEDIGDFFGTFFMRSLSKRSTSVSKEVRINSLTFTPKLANFSLSSAGTLAQTVVCSPIGYYQKVIHSSIIKTCR